MISIYSSPRYSNFNTAQVQLAVLYRALNSALLLLPSATPCGQIVLYLHLEDEKIERSREIK